jgi:outer membrane biosynthesis protein TonB
MSVQVYEDRDAINTKWITLFVLISLLAHAFLVLAIILITRYLPMPKMSVPEPPNPSVSLTLLPPPPAPPSQKRPTMMTDPQANVTPKNTLIESDNDTRAQTQSQAARDPNSLLPDVVSKRVHASNLRESPDTPTHQKPQPATAPSPPKQVQPKEQPTPPQPTPQPTQPPTPAKQPNPKPAPPNPAKTPSPQNTKPAVDPLTGLPVLPSLNAPTIAQQTSPTTPNQPAQPAVPPPAQPSQAEDTQGQFGITGAPSPEAMKTDLGAYKALFYRAVGSYWYPAVRQKFGLIGVGTVRIQVTIFFDGRVESKVLDDGGNTNYLLTISQDSILQVSPFRQFSDSMRKQVGDSFTDVITFNVYQ